MTSSILVVDDSMPMRAVIKKMVRAAGFAVDQFIDACNGSEALTILESRQVDLVLTDFNMPDMDGLALVRRLKANAATRSIPVVMITAEGSSRRLAEFIDAGAFTYIQKPFTAERIRETLGIILGESNGKSDRVPAGDDGIDF